MTVDGVLDLRIELDRPVERFGVHLGPHAEQIVHDVAAAKDQHAASAQRPQFLTQREVVRQVSPLVEADLEYGNISLWVDMAQHGPSAVIKSPDFIRLEEQLSHDSCCLVG